MGYQIALSPSARRDLRGIVRYIPMDSPEIGVRFGQFLVSSIKRLADFPEMGRVVPEFGDPSVREIVVRSYRVIYRAITAIPGLTCLDFGTPHAVLLKSRGNRVVLGIPAGVSPTQIS